MSLHDFNKEMGVSLFKMAGFSVVHCKEITNQYRSSYDDPWLLIQTEYGVIIIGNRKRVINIDWTFCPFRGVITEDEVTKNDNLIHAWSYEDALKYLTNLNKLMKEHSNA